MDPNGGNSVFAAAGGPTGLTAGLAELEEMRQRLFGPKKGNVIVPQTGAAPYYYVDPSAQQRAVLPDTQSLPQGIGLLPPNAPNILKRNVLGNAPRLAQDDRKELLRDIDNTIYGGGNAPAPTPTPAGTPRLASANSQQTDQWYSDMVHSYFQRPPSLDKRYNPDPESGQFQPRFVPGSRQYPNLFLT